MTSHILRACDEKFLLPEKSSKRNHIVDKKANDLGCVRRLK